MAEWVPKQKQNIDVTALDLSEDEGFVISRIDGKASFRELRIMTGFSSERLDYVMQKLIKADVIHAPESRESRGREKKENHSCQMNIKSNSQEENRTTSGAISRSGSQSSGDNQVVIEQKETRNYHLLFEHKFHPLDNDEREKLARTVTGNDLCALCFDPDYKVIRALFENLTFGLTHARLIAAHHRNPAGLDRLAENMNFMRDEAIQRFLLRNVQTSQLLLHKLTVNKQLLQIYQMIVSVDVIQRVKQSLHKILRSRFQSASGDEAAALIFKTEGRCLTMLTGVPLNGKTIALLCSHSYTSMLLVQNLARWASTPPKVLVSLFRQPMISRSPHIRNMILQHPNCPSQLRQ